MPAKEIWEITSFIATTIGLPVAAASVGILVWQSRMQLRQARREELLKLYGEQDTHTARLARSLIYNATPERFREPLTDEDRKIAEETLASLERMVYPIVMGLLPEDDAYNLYGGTVLSVSKCLWPYVEEQREMREKSPVSHKLVYRRFLEQAVRMFAGRYAREHGLTLPAEPAEVPALLNAILPKRSTVKLSHRAGG
jgi:hypothetical protein